MSNPNEQHYSTTTANKDTMKTLNQGIIQTFKSFTNQTNVFLRRECTFQKCIAVKIFTCKAKHYSKL